MALNMVLSPVISLAVKKAGDALIQQICQMWGMDKNRNKLHRQLQAIQRIIADAEERGEEWWLKELDAAAHEAVDVLDEFQYEALRQKAIGQGASAKVIKGFFSSENSIVFRYKMSNKLTKVLGKIDEIVTEMNKFNLIPRDPAASIDRETYSFVEESEVIGRDAEKEKIVSILLDPQRERDNISVLAIIGMGGLGKTTLAQLVYNDKRVKGHFQLLLWVCVSTEFNFINISKSIIEVATNSKGNISTSKKEVLQSQLREILDQKRYLLILDDVWNEDREKWDELRMLLFFAAGSGSIIIVTTRSQGVASIMGTLPGHDLASLSEEDSSRLFEIKAFGAWFEEPPEELCMIGKTIVRKCVGVPLAVRTLGALMGTKKELHDWRTILESNIWDDMESKKSISPILKLSYHHLPSHIKQCFVFCAIFPQDYIIEREILIQLWMANDFIPTDGSMKDLETKGQSIFNELYKRSFFQNFKEEETKYGPIITCKMHDLMHNLATEIAGNKCAHIENVNDPRTVQKEVHYLQYQSETINHGINIVLKKFPSIHTYLVNTYCYIGKGKKNSHLLKSSFLRALQFQFVHPHKELENMKHLKHLRYLNLSNGRFGALPETISTLYNLQTLNLSWTKIIELPTEMRYMINLRHLILDGCICLRHMPIGLGQLQYLQTLTKYVVHSDRGGTIGELSNLNLLCGHISLSGLKSVRDCKDAQIVNLAAKTNLCSLHLEWGQLASKSATRNNQEVLEALIPHKEIKYLAINSFNGFSFPNWMMEALVIRNLKGLELDECINCTELPVLWQLPLLEKLCLGAMKSLRHIVGGTGKYVEGSKSLITFPVLKVLELRNLPILENWREEDSDLVDFPYLNELIIEYCHKLKSIPASMPLLAYLRIFNSSEIKLHKISNLPMLSHLSVEVHEVNSYSKPDAFRPPKTLERMKIVGFENVNPLEEEEEEDQLTSYQRKSFRRLIIGKCNCFFSCGPIKVVALGFWKYFEALVYLEINACNAIVFWPEEEFRSLKCLNELIFVICLNLRGSMQVAVSGSSSTPPCEYREDSLPYLKSLKILGCPELVEIPICSKSLVDLEIRDCPKLSREGLAHLTNLSEIKIIKLGELTNLIAWPDNMEHLPSLEKLEISYCPRIESFPEGLQQRFPSLQYLEICGCPALERRCRVGGDYWHLVSPIPEKGF
ncbi:hypothetical protein LUZ63_011730 [Rhynchospora breviuscula]|uniref:Uncharacterized protein n=1 Tax=Rhynchospora breviuscula TaxID=2022672 RepID=A0A9Q0CJY4_9POAL|nr:hypothetical protein LUZ63_011730 [Rhynchospora breviuscula]